MTKIMELMERRAKAWDAAKNFLDTHSDNGGNVSAEDAATYDKMEKEVTDLTHDIERLQRQEQIDKMMSQPTSSPLTTKPGAKDEPDDKPGIASKAYKTAFWDSIRKRNWYDVQNVLEVGTDANGGYLVPDEYEHQLIQALTDENFFRSLAHVIQTDSGTHTIPIVASHGTASWMEENGLYPESDDTFDQITLSAYKLGTAIKVSEELMNDSVFDLESYISTEFARRIGAAEEEAFLVGDGQKKPEGVFTKVAATEGATTEIANTTLTFDSIMDVFHSLRSVYRNRAVWILNDSTVKALRKIKDGNNNYIWQPSVVAGQPDTILNRPYKTSIYAPELAAGNVPLLFGDFSYYWIADRQGRSFKRLSELYAANGQIGFLASERVDGKLILPEAVRGLSVKAAG
ncbi:phage major capsid protein [Ethanoligenens harbinense]|jgi:HK97 family phage major capsid protein|uniref:Phage major capsid protein, HK97 family n=1 Tax=Ethanoligenens harbinense (strain DSM 18485 / JCM 12961 / CGMCC 1.5033 / YUAN-3) TaxID=663278 RepID=E6UA01_ETHHY|nr:phage major capsid protein [Ethanoligenens harbinense]ADU27362.1 phage major capsid protein, HK97 family [Ethanoligenens harbinense YUAN-3]AVQ96425.1 phage major capsid protein [Ethanoligenens harbinense YUAN-3]AYF39083.1 phage major capsid protein [Ethanoligenens harbinense]AYF41909.1 phage major capsid protein [Ethanoligenens harbinense]QCN92666.1 phage major capsid protein [Ethanoligenens harbinense]